MPRKKPPREAAVEATEPVLPGVNPAADHDTPDESPPFPIVAVGASAGGIEAFTRLLGELPVDTGMAFVLIQHLSPKHESMLAGILGRATRLPVVEATNNARVEPNHAYVMPPGKTMVISHGLLQLGPRTEIGAQHRPIDHFMRSLGEEHGHKAIGVLLSGTGNDGSLGVNEIKAGGGITFAQDTTAEHDSMPRSAIAIASGAVDFVLPPEEIARELGRIAQHPPARRPAPGRGAKPRGEPRRLLIVDDNPDSAESMRLMYRLAGHEVRTVHEGAGAVEAAAALNADAVLLDIGLPDIDGYEVARRLRSDPRTRDVLIIAITGYGRDDDVRKSREAGIDDHVVKPVDPDKVLERVGRGRGEGRNSRASAGSDTPQREEKRQ